METNHTQEEIACIAQLLNIEQRRHIKKLMVVAGVMHRLHYSDQHVADTLWKLHDAPGNSLGFGIDLALILKLRVDNAEQGQERRAGALA